MKTNKNTWEDKLREHLGDDASRFPLSEDQFGSLKNRILAQKEILPARASKSYKLRSLWLLALPAAAVLAFFIMNRASVPVDAEVNPVSLNEASEGLYEQISEHESVLELDQEALQAATENGSLDELQNEVVLEDYLNEEQEGADDPFADLEAEEIEDYLVDHLLLTYEL